MVPAFGDVRPPQLEKTIIGAHANRRKKKLRRTNLQYTTNVHTYYAAVMMLNLRQKESWVERKGRERGGGRICNFSEEKGWKKNGRRVVFPLPSPITEETPVGGTEEGRKLEREREKERISWKN